MIYSYVIDDARGALRCCRMQSGQAGKKYDLFDNIEKEKKNSNANEKKNELTGLEKGTKKMLALQRHSQPKIQSENSNMQTSAKS